MKARLLLICMTILTTACGFHLRGSQLTELDIPDIYVTNSGAPKLAAEAKSQLERAGVKTTASSDDAAYIVTFKNESIEKSVLSVSASTGKAEEYQLNYKATMDVIDSNGAGITQNDRIQAIRDFTEDQDAVLGKFSEEQVINEDLVRSAAQQALRRLRALISQNK
jgi:LPS-assembly lipoprotein